MNTNGFDCARSDELAGAYALGALDPDEERAIREHLAGCDEPHRGAREVIEAAAAIPPSLEPVLPTPELRDRLMATVAETPQDHRRAFRAAPQPAALPRTPWWRLGAVPSAIAAVALAAAVGLGVWGTSLSGQLAERNAALTALAAADVIHPGSGTAGSGWVTERGDQATFVAADIDAPPGGQLYELWLIDASGTPVAVGTFTPQGGVASIPLERPVGDATIFAVTVEAERVDTPTSDPVFVAELGA
jgi:anti-sigma-K factor RskA